MTRLTRLTKPVKRETATVVRHRALMAELHAGYLTLREKRAPRRRIGRLPRHLRPGMEDAGAPEGGGKEGCAMNAIKLILDLHKHDGADPVSKLPGLWERKLDDRWTFWVNGHMEPLPVPHDAGAPEMRVLPGECYVEYNGWPAATFSIICPGDGIFAAGSAANYHTFCAALEAALLSPICTSGTPPTAKPGSAPGLTGDFQRRKAHKQKGVD